MRIKVSRMKIAVTALAASLAVAGLAGCSSDSADAPAEAGATVSTMFGDVEVPANPERVVALGWSDAETALALGTQPVGVADWMAFGGKGVGPWIADEFTTDPKILGNDGLERRRRHRARTGPHSVDEKRQHAGDLRQAQRHRARRSDRRRVWPLRTGRRSSSRPNSSPRHSAKNRKARRYSTASTPSSRAAIAANPNFAGKTAAVGAYSSDGYGAYVPGDARADFMTRLGFTIPTAITEKATGNFYIPVANENLNLFDADLTVLFPIFLDSSAFANDPLLRAIPSAQEGHLLILDDPALVNAFSSGSVPGLTYAIDNAVPKFASTLGA